MGETKKKAEKESVFLHERLTWLVKQGCYPCLSYRGRNVWRAHVNACGNFWDEGETPAVALDKALTTWTKAGRPMDGLAAT